MGTDTSGGGARAGASSASKALHGIALAAFSCVAWLLVCATRETREAWDDGLYFAALLPLLAGACAYVGWKHPHRPWVWPAAAVAGQALGLAITARGPSNLGPLPFFALAIAGIPCLLATLVAARASLARRSAETPR